MKALDKTSCSIAATLAVLSSLSAAQIEWTNSAGGNWSAPANWRPNQVPSASDQAIITNAGIYTVNADISIVVKGFTLGGTSGNQTLIVNGPSLTVNGPSSISSNVLASVFNGTLGGSGSLSVAGLLNLFGGSLTGTGSLIVETNGVVTLNGNINL